MMLAVNFSPSQKKIKKRLTHVEGGYTLVNALETDQLLQKRPEPRQMNSLKALN